MRAVSQRRIHALLHGTEAISRKRSMGFHSPQEAVRVLGNSVDMARQAEMSARLALLTHQLGEPDQATAP